MPRKAKDKVIEDLTEKEPVKVIRKKEPSKKVANKKESTKKTATKKTSEKKKAAKKVENKKASEKKGTTKKTATKKASEKKETTKKVATKKANDKKESTKKASTKKDSIKKVTTKATSKKSAKKVASKQAPFMGEYYDLPNQYEKTIVKILAQTPTILFVYWDISTLDRQNLISHYGETFFQETTPFLLVINRTKNYQFEIEVNDYANSWYLHIPDSDCDYEVILMRKNKNSQMILENNGRMAVTSSNNLETPNDHILFEKLGKTVFFKDVKTQFVQEKDISSFAFICNMGRIYNIYDLYKEIYQNELNGNELGASLTSSNFSSNFK